MVSWRGEDGFWYVVLRGLHDGSGFESEDMGPYDSRAEAETAGRESYAQDQLPADAWQTDAGYPVD